MPVLLTNQINQINKESTYPTKCNDQEEETDAAAAAGNDLKSDMQICFA